METNDLDQLIRMARPQVERSAADRAVLRIAPGFEAPAVPTPWLRIAALLLLAFGSGLGAVMWLVRQAPADASPALSAMESELAGIDRRLDALPGPSAAELEALNDRADGLITRPALPLEGTIDRAISEISAERRRVEMEKQRERHLAYVRNRYARDVEDTMARLKLDYNLNKKSEQELRAILAAHGAEVETLISRNYRGKTRSLRGEFASIKKATDARVQSVLSEVPLNMPGGDLAQWGPNPDYETQSDYESIQRWSEQAQQAG